jgi:hypothetical protein
MLILALMLVLLPGSTASAQSETFTFEEICPFPVKIEILENRQEIRGHNPFWEIITWALRVRAARGAVGDLVGGGR